VLTESAWAAELGQERDQGQELEPQMLQAPWPVLRLAFGMFAHVLERSIPKASPFVRSTLNLYLTVVLTFLAVVVCEPETRGCSSASALSCADRRPERSIARGASLAADARGG
jgi:hypothetical protein